MPVHSVKQLRNNTVLIWWEITESAGEMLEQLHDRFHDWTASARQKENKHWLASRLAILHHYKNEEVELVKDAYNKPHLYVDERPVFISITHSFEMAAVIVSPDNPVAVDLERFDDRIVRVKKKFCNADELYFAEHEHEMQSLTTIWAVKEALYKWYGKKELDFREHLQVLPFHISGEKFTVKGRIKKDMTQHELKVEVLISNDYLLAWIV